MLTSSVRILHCQHLDWKWKTIHVAPVKTLSQFSMRLSGKLQCSYLQCMDCKNATGEARCLLHAKVRPGHGVC